MFKLYEVDPEADTLLIVPHPARPFAPWRDEPGPADTTTAAPSDVYAGILRGTSRPPNIYASIASAPELRVKVSSRHLALASKHFRNRLRYPRPEGGRQENGDGDDNDGDAASDGRTHIALAPGLLYDPQAVITVMDIVHGRGRKVPRELPDVDALAKVAVVVDVFKLHDAVEVYAERWVAGLLRGGPAAERLGEATHERALILWIYASYVFRQADVFKAATRIAVLRSDGPIPSLGLQVREGVIRESCAFFPSFDKSQMQYCMADSVCFFLLIFSQAKLSRADNKPSRPHSTWFTRPSMPSNKTRALAPWAVIRFCSAHSPSRSAGPSSRFSSPRNHPRRRRSWASAHSMSRGPSTRRRACSPASSPPAAATALDLRGACFRRQRRRTESVRRQMHR